MTSQNVLLSSNFKNVLKFYVMLLNLTNRKPALEMRKTIHTFNCRTWKFNSNLGKGSKKWRLFKTLLEANLCSQNANISRGLRSNKEKGKPSIFNLNARFMLPKLDMWNYT